MRLLQEGYGLLPHGQGIPLHEKAVHQPRRENREMTSRKRKTFCVEGFVEIGVLAKVEAVSVSAALKFAKENRGGVQDIDWHEGDWESDVRSLCIVDCETRKVLKCE